MLDAVRTTPCVASTDAVARALRALTPDDLLRLKRVAQLRARMAPGLDWEELLNEALVRALDGTRAWPPDVPLIAFLAGIMRSLADARAAERRRLAELALGGDALPPVAPTESALHARQCLTAIDRFFADDPDVRELIAGLAELHLGVARKPGSRLSPRRQDAARKRLARAILRGQLDGFLP
jgi:RNA polymerase sigma-70 factor (ECF subfamily)